MNDDAKDELKSAFLVTVYSQSKILHHEAVVALNRETAERDALIAYVRQDTQAEADEITVVATPLG